MGMLANEGGRCPACGLPLDTPVTSKATRTLRCPVCGAAISECAHTTGPNEPRTDGDRGWASDAPLDEAPLLVLEEAEAYLSLDEYHDGKTGVRFRYPRGWVVTPRRDRVLIRPPDAALVPELLQTAGYAVAVTFVAEHDDGPADVPLARLQEFVAGRLTCFCCRHLLWQRRLRLPGGHPALAYCVDYGEEGHACRVIAAAAARAENLFFLDVAGLRTEIEALDQTCKRIVASLTL
jgi:hypothetical protein